MQHLAPKDTAFDSCVINLGSVLVKYTRSGIFVLWCPIRNRLTHCDETHSFDEYVFEGKKEIFYLTTHSTHFINAYMATHIW